MNRYKNKIIINYNSLNFYLFIYAFLINDETKKKKKN